ncbi:hypothetical protein QEH59_04115 [Coraliomargarita sp. SDUM461004]|uniref:Uncharacterized protein n=1 Tax=Thalassobacterium sedimentorum TaxID=3041258 RepID=A0ABU1AFK7_9BACT|nr:hypothetical protein [Coraliomargarita sp. SDUM461004]MDQ8193595.1 hypothetical protein [Coraliomargarita sp. SDUM461004]
MTALFYGLLISSLLSLTALAQSEAELFSGTWQIDTPEQGALVIIVKSQNRASYFWGDNSDRTVYQGTWTSQDQVATLTWPDGSQHRIERAKLGFAITHTNPQGEESYSVKAQQVPAEILGQWAKPPTNENEAISDRDKAKGFFGTWKIDGDDASPDYIFVLSDRSAASTEGGADGLRGSWAKQGSELHIAWDSGHYSILRPNKREFAYKLIEPGQIIEDDTTELRPAARSNESNVPSTWLENYREERKVHTGGIAFSSRKNARAFYRGDWIVKQTAERFERVEIARFGGLRTSSDPNLEGDWRMQGQDIFMRWDNGTRKILSPIGRGFVLYEYKPGRPLDGVPTRIRAAAPADSAKLVTHLAGRADVAQQMISLAEAAGIDPVQQQSAGWGRTFARWVWPFGEDEAAVSPDAMLQEEYEASNEGDPWWWPFWSEKSTATAARESGTQNSDEAALDAAENTDSAPQQVASETAPEAITEAQSNETSDDAPKTKSRSAREWVWPF